MNTTKRSRKFGIIIASIVILFVLVFAYYYYPRRPTRSEYPTTYEAFEKAVQKNSDMNLPTKGIIDVSYFDYTVEYESRFSNKVNGYMLGRKLEHATKTDVINIYCRHREHNQDYKPRADLEVNGKDVKIATYGDQIHYWFLSGDYLYTVICEIFDEASKDVGLDIVRDLARG